MKGSVAAFCGKDEYEVGDLSAEIDKRSRAKVFEFIGKDVSVSICTVYCAYCRIYYEAYLCLWNGSRHAFDSWIGLTELHYSCLSNPIIQCTTL